MCSVINVRCSYIPIMIVGTIDEFIFIKICEFLYLASHQNHNVRKKLHLNHCYLIETNNLSKQFILKLHGWMLMFSLMCFIFVFCFLSGKKKKKNVEYSTNMKSQTKYTHFHKREQMENRRMSLPIDADKEGKTMSTRVNREKKMKKKLRKTWNGKTKQKKNHLFISLRLVQSDSIFVVSCVRTAICAPFSFSHTQHLCTHNSF